MNSEHTKKLSKKSNQITFNSTFIKSLIPVRVVALEYPLQASRWQ